MNICPLQTGPGPMGTAAASSTPERARGVQVVCTLRPVAKNAPPSWNSRCLTARVDRVAGDADPRPCQPRPLAKSAARDPRARATRAARPSPDICQMPGRPDHFYQGRAPNCFFVVKKVTPFISKYVHI